MKRFRVVWAKSGKEIDWSDYPTLKWEWAKHLIYCDIDCFAVTEDGILILMDDCGNTAYPPVGWFKVIWEDGDSD